MNIFFIVACLVAGQVCYLAYAFNLFYLWALLLLLGLFVYLTRRALAILLFSSGLVLGWLYLPDVSGLSSQSGTALVRLVKPIKTYNVRDLKLHLKIIELEEGSDLIPLRRRKLICNGVALPNSNIVSLQRGDYFYVQAKFKQLEPKSNSFSLSYFLQGYAATCNIKFVSKVLPVEPGWADRFRIGLVKSVETLNLPRGDLAFFLSMSLGFDQDLDAEQWETFRITGLAHLLVVSGFQVTLVYCSCYYLLIFLVRCLSIYLLGNLGSYLGLVNLRIYFAVFSGILAFGFAEVVGFDAATLRAVIAMILLTIAKSLERRVSLGQVLLATFLIDCTWQPYCYLLPGTQLTYSALLGFVLAGRGMGRGAITSYVTSCFLATACSSLVAFYWFDNLYPIGILTNLLIAPFGALISCQLGLPVLFLNYYTNQKLEILLELVVWLSHYFERVVGWVSGYSSSYPFYIYVYLAIIIALTLHRLAVLIVNQKQLLRYDAL